jgi:hypothetical protein
MLWLAAVGLGSVRMALATGVAAVVCGCFVLSLLDLEALRVVPWLRSGRVAAGTALLGLAVSCWAYGSRVSRRFEWM